MTKREMIASLISEARQRSEELDESVDLFQDRSNWAAYVRQQLGESPECKPTQGFTRVRTLASSPARDNCIGVGALSAVVSSKQVRVSSSK